MSPTARTLNFWRKHGWPIGVVERWVSIPNYPGGGKRYDLFGFIDLVGIRDGQIVGIQATSTANRAARVAKIKMECWPEAKAWLAAGGLIEVWGWRKYKQAENGRWWRHSVLEVTT